MRSKLLIPLLILVVFLSSCQFESPASTPTATKTPIVWPTATYRVWRTIAPDNVASPTPTPTLRPLRSQPQGRIAFQSDQSGSLDIYVMNADGTQQSRITTDAGVDVFPSWSPDGEKIVFTSDMDGNPDIYIVNADGTDLERIVNNPANDVLPAWSPDGEKIAFVSDRDGNNEIYVMNANGSNVRKLTNDPNEDSFPSWSPDSEWIVFSSTRDVNSEIYKMGRDGKNLTRLTDDPAADSNPSWSPDGTRIAFISKRDGFANLYVMDTKGKDVTQLTTFKSILEVPSWSPDSKTIVFASDLEGSRDLFIISSDGQSLDHLTDFEGEEFYPSWSPNLETITEVIVEPTAAPGSLCQASTDSTYGYTLENPVRIGYDPRQEEDIETGCLPWLLGPNGQELSVELLEEVEYEGRDLCKISVSYEGQAEADVMYFDINTYEQPKAPVGYSCGSPVEYLKAITAARY